MNLLSKIFIAIGLFCGPAVAGPGADELAFFTRISSGSSNGFANTGAPYGTGFGYQACTGATGTGNSCFGFQAGSSLTTGTYNTIFGYNSVGPLATPTNGYVTSFGANNFGKITSAFEIESFGGYNFINCTTCNSSTAVGDDVLDAAVTSIDNVGVGNWTLTGATDSYNTAVGWKAIGGVSNSAQLNTAVGYIALEQDNLTGGSNTAIGAQSLLENVQGYYNTALGFQSGVDENYGHGNLCLGITSCGGVVYGADNIFIQSGQQHWTYPNGMNDAFVVSVGSTLIEDYGATNASEWTISGNVVLSGTTPTIASGACGATTNGTVAGSDNSFFVTIGSASTASCTVSWHATLAVAPRACVLSQATGSAASATILVAAPTTTGVTFTATALASTTWNALCF